MNPALLEEITDATPLLEDPAFCMEEKLNGRRLLLVKHGDVVRAYSRNGIEYVAPLAIIEGARQSGDSWILDGELVGEEFASFDLLSINGLDYTKESCDSRYRRMRMLNAFPSVARHFGNEKRAVYADMQSKAEGVVFKRFDGQYQPGQRTYGFKFKFYKTATVRAVSIDISKGSMAISLDGEECGRVSFPFNSIWPKAGELWEVRYDEVSRNGKLLRPQLLMRRDDLELTS